MIRKFERTKFKLTRLDCAYHLGRYAIVNMVNVFNQVAFHFGDVLASDIVIRAHVNLEDVLVHARQQVQIARG